MNKNDGGIISKAQQGFKKLEHTRRQIHVSQMHLMSITALPPPFLKNGFAPSYLIDPAASYDPTRTLCSVTAGLLVVPGPKQEAELRASGSSRVQSATSLGRKHQQLLCLRGHA